MSLDLSSMHTHQGVLDELFKSTYNFAIPRFQRDYDWKQDQIEEFWDDLVSHYNDWENSRDQIQYYFGSLMLVRVNQNTNFLVIDGQQRLTTCMIFFVAIRDFFLEHGISDDVKNLNKIIFFLNDEKKSVPRIRLNRYNNPFFSESILPEKSMSEKVSSFPKKTRMAEKTLKNAYLFFNKKFITGKKRELAFSEKTLDERIIIFRGLYEHLLEHFEVVRNIFDNKQRAYRIFETINHKGLRLSENDLVKNYLLEWIDDTKSIEETQDLIDADDQWNRITTTLQEIGISEDKCLKLHLTAFEEKTKKDKIFEKISKKVTTKEEAQNFLSELEESANFLSQLRMPYDKFWNNDKELLDNLEGYKNISDGGMYPILLAANKKFKDDADKLKKLKKLIELITKLHFRAKTVCGISFTFIESLVNSICKIINESDSDPLPEIKKEVLGWSGYPNDNEFDFKFSEFETKSDSTAKYALKEIEYKKTGGRRDSAKMIRDDIEVEHIMPREIDEWKEDLTKIAALKKNGFPLKDYHERNLYKFGNLTLVAPRPNKIYSNKPFKIKKFGSGADSPAYRDELSTITSSLTEYDNWTELEIDTRQKGFLTHAKEIWNLENL